MKGENDKLKIITELISAVAVTLTGIFLMLCALGAIPLPIGRSWWLSTLICLFVISLTLAVQKNVIGITFAWALGALIIAQILILVGFSHSEVYPLYVIALPLGALNGGLFTPYAGKAAKICAVLIGGGLLLLLESTNLLPVKVVLPILAVYFGLVGAAYSAIKLHRYIRHTHNKENER